MWMLCLVLIVSSSALAQTRLITKQNIADAILERQTFLPVEMDSLDLNRDGTVNIADLTFFLLRTLNLVPSVSFETSNSKAFEGDGTLPVRLVFTKEIEVATTLTFTAGGTATYGEGGDYTIAGYDFVAGQGTIALNPGDTEAVILITLADDAVFDEGVETVTFSLTGGSTQTYFLGPGQTHTFYIDDNDSVWFAGADFENGGRYESFRLEITQNNGTFDGRVLSDDLLIPRPEEGDAGASGEDGWDARFYAGTQTLRIEIGPIPIDRTRSLFDTHQTRSYVLEIGPGLGTYEYDPKRQFTGLATSKIEAVKSRLGPRNQRLRFLNCEVVGDLILKRQPSKVVSEEIVFEDE